MTYLLVASAVTALCALLTTKLLLALTRRYEIVDKSNFRSLHTGSVPRGGGAAIALTVMAAVLTIHISRSEQGLSFYYPFIIVFGVAVLGVLEDVIGVPVILRLGIQIMAGVLLALNPSAVENSYLMIALLTVSFVWCVNGSNFMDGSDGLLTSQATLIFGFVAFVAINTVELTTFAIYPAVMAASCFGFLYWNWQRARIFLGDVGSYFIGAGFGAMLVCAPQFNVPRAIILILLIPLLTDATLTVIKRSLERKRIWRAHREHVYQSWILKGVSHRRVAIVLGLAFGGIFAPLGYLALKRPDLSLMITIIAIALGVFLWLGAMLPLRNKSTKIST